MEPVDQVSYEHVFPQLDEVALDFLKRIFTFDTEARMTAAQGLQHPYLAAFHDPDDEPDAPVLFNDESALLDLETDGWKSTSFL